MASVVATDSWLPAAEFAALTQVGARAAQLALRRCHEGRPWRGHRLQVRKVQGRGGASGWVYEVRADSLPEEFRPAAQADLPAPAPVRDPATVRDGALARWRYDVIKPALSHPAGSSERAWAKERAARVLRDWPSGRRRRVSARTIEDWIAAYERDGMAGLARTARADGGEARVHIGRAWDAGVPFDDAARARIAEATAERVRSLWAATTEIGWRQVSRLATDFLIEQTVAAGFDPGKREVKKLCRLPRRFVEVGRPYRAVAIYDKDRKRHFDAHMPRIQRTREGRTPMEIVIGDVHPIDILMQRPDGSVFTPKLIAWHDWANNRMFCYPVFLGKGEGVRQEHVAEAFMAMAAHPLWGMPQTLYLDNGGEYNWAELVDDAMQLNLQVRLLDDDAAVAGALKARRSAIVNAQPYNAPAKAVEGLFGVLEGGALSMLPGWIGGNRMRKKTANVGREPAPYPGDEEDFRRSLATAIEYYETTPQGGALNGRSPREAFAEFVEAGWQRMDVDPAALRTVFARPESRVVRQGGITVDGNRYTSRTLQGLPAGTRVEVRIPLVGDRSELAILDSRSKFLCMAETDRPYDALDPEGAAEAGRRRRANREAIEAMRRETHPVDLERAMASTVAKEAPAPIPESAGTIGLDAAAERIGREAALTPAERKARDRAESERRMLAETAERKEFLRLLRASV